MACLGEELADRAGDLLDVGFQGEVTAVDEPDVGVGEVALEGLGPGGQEEGPGSVVVVVEAAGDDGDHIGLDVVHEPVLLGYPA
jgi:hypothetical protein